MVENLQKDAFVVSELFENTFNGLAGVYSRCFTNEGWKSEPNMELITNWKNRFSEITKIQREIPKMKVDELALAIEKYNPELRKMLEFESNNYGK